MVVDEVGGRMGEMGKKVGKIGKTVGEMGGEKMCFFTNLDKILIACQNFPKFLKNILLNSTQFPQNTP